MPVVNGNQSESSQKFRYLGLMALCIGVIIVQVIAGYIIYRSPIAWEVKGQFGDMFGAVNTLFAGLAFAGVVYAIFLQKNELELQREELKLTRSETYRPIVTARIETVGGGNAGIALNIVVQNSGNRPAKNIQLNVDESELNLLLQNPDDKALNKDIKSCFSPKGIISILENGRQVSNSFGALSTDKLKRTWKDNAILNIDVFYCDLDGRDFNHRIPLKIADAVGFAGSFWGKPSWVPIGRESDAVEKYQR